MIEYKHLLRSALTKSKVNLENFWPLRLFPNAGCSPLLPSSISQWAHLDQRARSRAFQTRFPVTSTELQFEVRAIEFWIHNVESQTRLEGSSIGRDIRLCSSIRNWYLALAAWRDRRGSSAAIWAKLNPDVRNSIRRLSSALVQNSSLPLLRAWLQSLK